MSERSTPAAATAVVLGGSHTGMLVARALAGSADRVVVVERDVLPTGPEPRRGLPQARHAHMLWSGGALAMEELLPGVTAALGAAGARRMPVTTDVVALSARGWFRRWPESHHVILAGRDLLDATVRAEVLRDERIELLDGTEVVGLEGSPGAVEGVRLRALRGRSRGADDGAGGGGRGDGGGQGDGDEYVLRAGLVVDATGRGSGASARLAALGVDLPQPREVDSGLVYASRLYLAPEPAREGFPVVNVQPDPRAGGPGRAGFLVPVEDGRWIVTLSGTRGGEPTADEAGFERFAREELRHPLVGELLAAAEPLSGVTLTRATVNRRTFFEQAPAWPENLAVVGDALAAFNPVYGQGLAAAAQSVLALRRTVRRHGWGTPGLSRRIQKAVARPVRAAWDLAIGQDAFYPGPDSAGPTLRDRVVAAYVARLMYTATGNGRVARRVTDVTSMERRAEVLLAPDILLAAALGPLKPALSGPPLTADERKAGGLA